MEKYVNKICLPCTMGIFEHKKRKNKKIVAFFQYFKDFSILILKFSWKKCKNWNSEVIPVILRGRSLL